MKYRSRPAVVEAMQFTGSDTSAREVIEWGAQLQPPLEINRYWHKGSWNDREPELWLHCGNATYVEPGDWVVHDGHRYAEVWGHTGFEQEYEAVEVPT